MDKLQFNRVPYPEGSNRIGPKNANVQYFSGSEDEKIDTLIRETIQNPLDNIENKSKPLIMNFEEINVPVNEIPHVHEIRKTIDALIHQLNSLKQSEGGQIDKLLQYYEAAKFRLQKETIVCLKISDYNTTGLIGSRSDNTSNIGRFLGGSGYFDDSSTGGGSGGLGKFAPFRFSAINFCFYSSYNTLNEYIYYGWGNNFYHEIDGTEYYGETAIGDESDVLKLKSALEKGFLSERTLKGTDVFVIGHQNNLGKSWLNTMTKSTIRNFFASIIDNHLKVKVTNIYGESNEIDTNSINDYLQLFDPNKRRSDFKSIPSDAAIVETIDAYSNGKVFDSEDTEIKTPNLGQCKVHIIRNDDYSKFFAFMRGPKMLIYTKKFSRGDLPYSGVFTCISKEGNEILRNIEDSHHKNWPFGTDKRSNKIKKEIDRFVNHCINVVASHDSKDTFELSGTNLFSMGASKRAKTGEVSDEITDEDTAIIFPKKSFTNNIKTFTKFGGVVIVDKDGKRKKIEPKKPPYKKPNKPSPQEKTDSKSKKRRYTISDFEAQVFKNDEKDKEYHMFINSKVQTRISKIFFSIPGAEHISFIENILDDDGNIVERNIDYKESENAFQNLPINEGKNKITIRTNLNNKIELLIK